jgi:hypothetical protein
LLPDTLSKQEELRVTSPPATIENRSCLHVPPPRFTERGTGGEVNGDIGTTQVIAGEALW